MDSLPSRSAATQFLQTHLALILSVALVGGSLLLQGNIGLNLADEGHLWVGAIRTAAGEIPTLDFHSYDPGRYYWIAGWFALFGQSILGLRLALAMFQLLGLWLGLLAVQCTIKQPLLLIFAGLLLICWMIPRYKLFEHSLALIGIWAAVRLIDQPNLKNHLLVGFCIGLAAFFGRNHGLYQLVGFAALIALQRLHDRDDQWHKRLGAWALGILIGFAPMLIMFLFIPDMFSHYLQEYVLIYISRRATNLSTPVPFFWTSNYHALPVWDASSAFAIGLLYVLMPVFYLAALAFIVIRRRGDLSRYSLLAASVCIGMPYLHHAFDRARAGHLAQSIPALIIAAIAVIAALRASGKRTTASMTTVCWVILTGLGILPYQPIVQRLRRPNAYIQYSITGDSLWITRSQARYLDTITQFVDQTLAPDELLFVAPIHPPYTRSWLASRRPTMRSCCFLKRSTISKPSSRSWKHSASIGHS